MHAPKNTPAITPERKSSTMAAIRKATEPMSTIAVEKGVADCLESPSYGGLTVAKHEHREERRGTGYQEQHRVHRDDLFEAPAQNYRDHHQTRQQERYARRTTVTHHCGPSG
jgi:hypothetical protein